MAKENGTKKYLNMGLDGLRKAVDQLHTRQNSALEKMDTVKSELKDLIHAKEIAMNDKIAKLSAAQGGNTVSIENIAGLIQKQQEIDEAQGVQMVSIGQTLVGLQSMAKGVNKMKWILITALVGIVGAGLTYILGFNDPKEPERTEHRDDRDDYHERE